MLTQPEIQRLQTELVTALVETARLQPDRKYQIRDQSGAVVATVEAHITPTRPKDMPRHLRPKRLLSKRQRVAARREKLAGQSD